MNQDRITDIFFILIIAVIIGLKITGIITISWLALFSPILVLLGVGFLLAIGFLFLYILAYFFGGRDE